LAVQAFGGSSPQWVDGVVDGGAIGQLYLAQLAPAVVAVAGGAAGVGFGLQFACGGVGVAVVPPAQQPVLGVVFGYDRAVFVGAVAVGVVVSRGGGCGALRKDAGKAMRFGAKFGSSA
jgi:hypothetical protein